MAAPKMPTIGRLDLTEVDSLLTFVLRPEKLQAIRDELATQRAELDHRIAALGTLQDAEVIRAQATAARDEARQLRDRAEELRAEAAQDAAQAKSAADALVAEAQETLLEAARSAASTRQETKDWVRQLHERETLVGKRAEVLTVMEADCQRREAAARLAQEAAEAFQRDLEQKLATFQAMMGKRG